MTKNTILILLLVISSSLFSYSILFDNTKHETAGNADWVIGSYPSWNGGFSDYGSALRALGYQTSTLENSNITYSALQNYDVFIIPEPQDPFSYSEKQAILTFIQNGGGVFLIADHDGADRNNNGWDAQDVFNNSLNTMNNFHFEFDENSIWSENCHNIENPRTYITEGLNNVGYWAGSSISSTEPAVEHIWKYSTQNVAFLVTSQYGSGRVAGWGDSSTFDDGTGHSGNNLYDGWNEIDDARLGVNVVKWLLKLNTDISEDIISNNIYIKNNPSINEATFLFPLAKKDNNNFSLAIYNLKGELVRNYQNKTDNIIWKGYNTNGKKVNSGVYFYKSSKNNKIRKFIFIK